MIQILRPHRRLAAFVDIGWRPPAKPEQKAPLGVAMEADEIRPTAVPLPRNAQVRRIEIQITKRDPGGRWKGYAGFTEVALERRGN